MSSKNQIWLAVASVLVGLLGWVLGGLTYPTMGRPLFEFFKGESKQAVALEKLNEFQRLHSEIQYIASRERVSRFILRGFKQGGEPVDGLVFLDYLNWNCETHSPRFSQITFYYLPPGETEKVEKLLKGDLLESYGHIFHEGYRGFEIHDLGLNGLDRPSLDFMRPLPWNSAPCAYADEMTEEKLSEVNSLYGRLLFRIHDYYKYREKEAEFQRQKSGK